MPSSGRFAVLRSEGARLRSAHGRHHDHAARRTHARGSRRHHRGRPGGQHRPGAGQGGRDRLGQRHRARPGVGAGRRRRGRHHHGRLRARPLHHPPQHHARDGPGGARPVPGRHVRHRPAGGERLLLRLRAAAGRPARTFVPEDLERIEARMREIIAESQPFVRDEISDEVARTVFAGHRFKLEIIDGEADDPTSATEAGLVRTYENPPATPSSTAAVPRVPGLHRPVPRPPRAQHQGVPGPLQAHARGRRLLARRREEPDAPAHLRHGVGVQGRTSTSTSTSSRRPPSATTAASPRSSTSCRSPRSSAAAWPCGTPRAASSASSWRTTPGSATPRAATSSSTRPTSPTGSSSRPRATSTSTRTGCTRPWRWTTASTTRSR